MSTFSVTLEQANQALKASGVKSHVSDGCVEFGTDEAWIGHFSNAELTVTCVDSHDAALEKIVSRAKKSIEQFAA